MALLNAYNYFTIDSKPLAKSRSLIYIYIYIFIYLLIYVIHNIIKTHKLSATD